MAVGTEVVAVRYENITEGAPISVPFPLYEAPDIQVIYGIAALTAVYNTDYTITLGDDFDTFTLTPTASLIAKINALIALDPDEENYITVRRRLDYLTDATAAAVRYTPFTSREFERTVLRFQQIQEQLNRALVLSPNFVGGQPLLQLNEISPGATLIVNEDGTAIGVGPTAAQIEAAEQYAQFVVGIENEIVLLSENIVPIQALAVNIADEDGSINTVAGGIDDVNRYANTVMEPSLTAPTTRPDGSALQPGDLWYYLAADPDDRELRVYNGAAFVSASTSSLGGLYTDDGTFGAAPSGEITVGAFQTLFVWVNGSLLKEGVGYTQDGTSFTITSPVEGDEWAYWAYQANDATDYYTKIEADNLFVELSGENVTDPLALRNAANVRGRVNFFDFLQETRSSAVREQIMNGTFTGDLAVEWQAFRNALAAIDTAGGRPYGFIPECKIYSSVAPNFAMDYLTLDTQGHVRIEAIGPITGFLIDGMGLGANGYGVRHMNIGPLCASTATGTYGIRTRRAHMSDFWGFQSLGAGFAGINVDGCVTSNFHKPIVTNQAEPFIATPAIGLLATGTSGGDGSEPWHALIQTSWCKFDIPIMEWVPVGTVLEHTYGNTIMGGTSEGCSDIGLQLSQFALYNKIIGHDLEVNTNYDLDVQGSFNDFFGCDIQTMALFRFGAHDNRMVGGHWGHVTFDSTTQRNLITAANVNGITDNSTGADRNRVSNVTDNAGNWSDRWIPYTPLIAPVSGAFGTASAEGEFKISDGDTVEFRLTVSIPGNGTAAGAVVATLPFAAASAWTFTGAETAVLAKAVSGRVSASSSDVSIRNSDGSYPAIDGAVITVAGTYRRA